MIDTIETNKNKKRLPNSNPEHISSIFVKQCNKSVCLFLCFKQQNH